MTPQEAGDLIDKMPAKSNGFELSAGKVVQLIALLSFVATLVGAVQRLGLIPAYVQGALVIGMTGLVLMVILILALWLRRKIVRPTMHLDKRGGLDIHTIDKHFDKFDASGDILLLQTWIPEDTKDVVLGPSSERIKRWGDSLCKAMKRHKRKAKGSIRFRVLLVGAEEVLSNRIRYRYDLMRQFEGDYPLLSHQVAEAVGHIKRRIDSSHEALLKMERRVQNFLKKEALGISFKVSIRYYKFAPCGPLYIFGEDALLTGFFDFRWTSDRAPTLRLNRCKTREWEYFRTLFECAWDLRGNEGGEGAPELYTSRNPTWR